MPTSEEWFRETSPGFTPGTGPADERTGDPTLPDQTQFLLDKQVGMLRELKAEARETLKLQAATLAAFATALTVVESQLRPGGFFPPETAVEGVGITAAAVSGGVFLAVFLLVPRPMTRNHPLLSSLPGVRPTRSFRFPGVNDDGTVCLRFNDEVI